jgi:hypothetical protein
MADIIKKTFSNSANKDVKYLNRDFNSFKDALLEYAKTYFPTSYKDFSPASPGTMFIEMAAYVGDVLSYYTDYQFKESLLPYAEERKNVIALASYLGYKTKPTKSASANIDVYQLIPAIKNSDGEYVPDDTYALIIREYMEVTNSSGNSYITSETLDFSIDTAISPRESTVYTRDDYGIPQFFMIKKSVKVVAGSIITYNVTVGNPTKFFKIVFPEKNVLSILEIKDSDNNNWYEVDYLAQDTVFIENENNNLNNGNYSQYNTQVSKLLNSIRTSKKYIVKVDADNNTYLEFGSGTEVMANEVFYPTSDLVGIGLQNLNKLNISYDDSRLLNTDSYGQIPSNTTLTIKYLVGGGVLSNCPSEDIKNIKNVTYLNDLSQLTPSQNNLFQTLQGTVRISNPDPATGGKDSESIDEIRNNALANFSSQNRAVTIDDYIVRVYGLPPRFGSIAKVFVSSNSNTAVNINNNLSGFVDSNNSTTLINDSVKNYLRKVNYDVSNPFSINLYVLSYDSNKNLTQINPALYNNIRKYLNRYKMLTDGINIIDGYIINIGVDIKVLVYSNYNKREVIDEVINKTKNFFDIDKLGFNQTINISQLQLEIANVEGVQSVINIKFRNLTSDSGNYSPHEYNLEEATLNNIIYPSLDPSCWEIKYPDNDIRVSCQ